MTRSLVNRTVSVWFFEYRLFLDAVTALSALGSVRSFDEPHGGKIFPGQAANLLSVSIVVAPTV